MTADQTTTIEPEIIREHYAKKLLNIEDYSDFIMQRKLIFVETEMLRELLDKKKMQDAISKKGNL
jgi:hypothetical protein